MTASSPVVFSYGGRTLVATSAKEGKIYLLDAKSLGGKDHHTPLYVSPRWSNDALLFSMNGMWSVMKILIVVGARPNFMKAAPIITAIHAYNRETAAAPWSEPMSGSSPISGSTPPIVSPPSKRSNTRGSM